ncbi:proteasome assembly chaperone family protein [Candidatus Woesearchaeota archaeon]|nr:proteasome assembly chaperone family protein [Candidatus Woesearchaeota archaeon]
MMQITLQKKPKNPIIIEGFPGLGLIGTITTEFLIKHLKAKPIGNIWSKELLPVVAIHENKIVQPLEIFYAEKENILIVHALSDIRGMEWDISDSLMQLYRELDAKEIISIEGILSTNQKPQVYYFTNDTEAKKKFDSAGILQLKEGIIMGVTAALLLKNKDVIGSGIFVESHTKLPDSMSAAKVIEILDKYLGLKIDYKPLIQAASEFEKKLKDIIQQSQRLTNQPRKLKMNYFG